MPSIFRDAAWLTTDRVRAWTSVLLALTAAGLVLRPLLVPAATMGYDSMPLWITARMAGQGFQAYGPEAQAAVLALGGPESQWICGYPPTALLLWLPLSVLSFPVAVGLFLGGTAALYAAAIRGLSGTKAVLAALAYPAVAVCLLYGQNSLLSAALLAGAAATLDRRPLLAGLMIGCLAFKPQLAVLAPLALALSGRWRAFAGAAIGALGFVSASILAFGIEDWMAYPEVLRQVEAFNMAGAAGFEVFVSLLSSARLLGASERVAWSLQGVGIVLAIAVLAMAVKRRRATGWSLISLLITATAFCVPFLGEYDLLICVVPGLWLASEAIRNGWLPYERIALAGLFVSPWLILVFSSAGIPLGPVALAVLAWMVLRRHFRGAAAAKEDGAGCRT